MSISFRNPEAFARTVGISAGAVATFKSIATWVAAASTVVGVVAVAADIIKAIIGGKDPIQEALDQIREEIKKIGDQNHRTLISDRLERATGTQGLIKDVADGIRSFAADHSAQHRRELVNALNVMRPKLLGHAMPEANLLPFHPETYTMLSGNPAPHWMMGGDQVYAGAHLMGQPESVFASSLPPSERSWPNETRVVPATVWPVQVMRPLSASYHDWQTPDSLNASHLRWDGRFHAPVLMAGALCYLNGIRFVEPYFRSTGHERERLLGLIEALSQFAADWYAQILVSAPMPAPHFDHVPATPFSEERYLPRFTFSSWPCGAADPAFGTSAYQPGWWVPDPAGFSTGLMGQDQMGGFFRDRQASLKWVCRNNGLSDLWSVINSLGQLLFPPPQSETLGIYADRAQTETLSALSTAQTSAETFNILVPPTTFDGVREARAVKVRVPIAIQANPGLDGVPNLRRLASSDVTFGYKVELVGNDGTRISVFESQVRRLEGEEGLWHTGDPGPAGLKPVPRFGPDHDVELETATYLRFVDSSGATYWTEEEGEGRVLFSCRVQVSDPAHDPIPGLEKEWPPRGVLWLEVTSENAANPSFSVSFAVTETIRVSGDGTPSDDELVTYTAEDSVSVDAQVAVFPTQYFEQYEAEREMFYAKMQETNRKYRPVKQIFDVGPPEELIDPLGPLYGPDHLAGITHLLDDHASSSAVVEEIRRATSDGIEVNASTIRHGIAKAVHSQAKAHVKSVQVGRWTAGPG
ncbi:hypothetical protein [Nonomuraea sp. NPDC023979]|uniref:hypothetical protein n=1 Tax=Nonomuraea sp. NPDC023979 TaxID=3154796 RepID=UPI0033FDF226